MDKLKSIKPSVVAKINEADCTVFGSEDWRPNEEGISPIPITLWRGGRQLAYVIQNANVVSPDVLNHFAAAGEWIRKNHSHTYVPLKNDVEVLRDLAAELKKAQQVVRSWSRR